MLDNPENKLILSESTSVSTPNYRDGAIGDASYEGESCLSTVEIGRTYINRKTNKRYKVLHLAYAAWDSDQKLVVYIEWLDGKMIGTPWVRSLKEYKEKFTKDSHNHATCSKLSLSPLKRLLDKLRRR
jgi:hypothetical protein